MVIVVAAAAEWRKKRPCWEGHLSRAIGTRADGPVLMIHLVQDWAVSQGGIVEHTLRKHELKGSALSNQ